MAGQWLTVAFAKNLEDEERPVAADIVATSQQVYDF